ncbi:hypothetical protein [Solidesulfovibrio sp.]|uniref:hypothetical protein n=1 Tax=Solidesulfovibrio sp. TaxID=2910990 RepID=UPI002603C6EF|nr:hypothetical protein [Solidesulfovibrio sp.]
MSAKSVSFTLLFGLAACLLVAGPLAAQTARTTPQGVAYVTGGVGTDERAAMEAMAGAYTLKMEFARSDRAYLGDVAVSLRGPVATQLTAEGPVLLLQLPPGRYAVTATALGTARTQTVTVGKTGLARLAFLW